MTSVVSPPAAVERLEVSPAADVPVADEPQNEPEPIPAQRPRRREALVVVAQGLTIFGLVVAAFAGYVVGVSALEHGRSQRSLRLAFGRDLTSDNAWIGGEVPEGSPIAQIEIAKIGVREIVVEGTTGSILRSGPGHLRTAPLPGQPGNAVIAGRRVAYGGPFRHLDSLRNGDRIVTTTGQGRSIYRVSRVTEISRHAKDAIDDFGDNRLTLMTSAPELKASRRLVVTAALDTPPRAALTARATDIHQAELGLHSDGSSAFALLLWAQVALLASVATAWLLRRWRPWPTYLITAPVLALLILFVFDSLTPLLPSTL